MSAVDRAWEELLAADPAAMVGAISSRAYRALVVASERIGASQYASQRRRHIASGKSPRTYRYTPTRAHLDVVAAMSSSPNDDEAYALLSRGDVLKERMEYAR